MKQCDCFFVSPFTMYFMFMQISPTSPSAGCCPRIKIATLIWRIFRSSNAGFESNLHDQNWSKAWRGRREMFVWARDIKFSMNAGVFKQPIDSDKHLFKSVSNNVVYMNKAVCLICKRKRSFERFIKIKRQKWAWHYCRTLEGSLLLKVRPITKLIQDSRWNKWPSLIRVSSSIFYNVFLVSGLPVYVKVWTFRQSFLLGKKHHHPYTTIGTTPRELIQAVFVKISIWKWF